MILIALVIVVLAVVIIKAIFGEGTPLKGGMPSGHSALAFSISTAIALITEKPICIILAYLMAFITAQSRVDSEVHTVFEVIVGGVLGILLTLLIFKIFLPPVEPITLENIGIYLLPISHSAYWFVTAYIVLMLISPFVATCSPEPEVWLNELVSKP